MLLLFLSSVTLLQAPQAGILDSAIAAAGGRRALEAAPVLQWSATASIHIPNRTIEIAGEWYISPDSVESRTHPVDQPAGIRRMILKGKEGWTQRGNAEPGTMPPELLIEEIHQFYLYQVLRLVPLLQPEFTLHTASADTLGTSAIRVSHAGHPDVTLFFDREHRVTALRTVFAAPDMSSPESQEILLAGAAESAGIRWFTDLRIFRAGKPYFDLHLTSFTARPQ